MNEVEPSIQLGAGNNNAFIVRTRWGLWSLADRLHGYRDFDQR